jgi:hypothetical protein
LIVWERTSSSDDFKYSKSLELKTDSGIFSISVSKDNQMALGLKNGNVEIF